MASRIIHLAIAGLILEKHPLPEPDRFYLGSVLPDACADKSAHYKKYLANGSRKTHDLTGFREKYGDRLLTDSLYLGYYLHLLEDVVFRYDMYEILRFDPTPTDVERLHLDYQLTNRYVIRRYGVSDRLTVPDGIEAEPLFREWAFALPAFLEELHRDFRDRPQGKTVFFTEEIADRVISRSAEAALREIDALHVGTGYFDEVRWSWARHTSQGQN